MWKCAFDLVGTAARLQSLQLGWMALIVQVDDACAVLFASEDGGDTEHGAW